jgi:hypothetical protein
MLEYAERQTSRRPEQPEEDRQSLHGDHADTSEATMPDQHPERARRVRGMPMIGRCLTARLIVCGEVPDRWTEVEAGGGLEAM